jgi:nucleotide-binding universal stress UspA family protein
MTGSTRQLTTESPAESAAEWPAGSAVPLIMVSFDGSSASARAVAYAAGVARRQRHRLLVVNLVDALLLAGFPGSSQETQALADLLGADAAEEIANLIGDTDLHWQLVHARGDPFTELVRVADRQNADAVITSAPRATSWPRRRSLPTRLARLNQWPVTVVP